MIDFDKYRKKLFEDIKIEKENTRNKRVYFSMKYEQFTEAVILKAKKILLRRNEFIDFVIDKENEPFIKALHYWSIDETANGYKGILLTGDYGTGKTLILTAFVDLYNEFAICQGREKCFRKVWSRNYNVLYKEKGLEYYANRPLYIEELGKEEEEMKDYGNRQMPMIDTLLKRYANGEITFACSNFKIKDLEDIYQGTLADRLKAMFIWLELTGKTRRK